MQLSHEHKSSRRPGYPKISKSLFVWALHSDSQEYILEQCPDIGRNPQGYLWEDLRAYGAGYWIKSAQTLRQYIEKIARNTFAKDNKPLDAAIWYLILNKKTLLWSLFKSVHDTRLANFFGFDFTTPENQTKALKNAYALMGMCTLPSRVNIRRFECQCCYSFHVLAMTLCVGSASKGCKNRSHM